MSFANKVVLITGGSAGIGATTAKFFAKKGAKVALVDRNVEDMKCVAKCCQELGASTLEIHADIAKDESAELIIKKAVDKFGKLDVLVNNAGILKKADILSENFLEIYDIVMNINLRGPVRITHYAGPHLIKSKGNIVNVSSVGATTTKRPGNTVYRTSKAALNHFTRCIAYEMAPHGVRVNLVSPGPVKTSIYEGSKVDIDTLKKHSALKRILNTDEIADMIVYLASERGKGITGSNFVIDNGYTLM